MFLFHDPQTCHICQRLPLYRDESSHWLIHQFEPSFFVIDDHQFHRGYGNALRDGSRAAFGINFSYIK